MHQQHKEIVELIRINSGSGMNHTFTGNYLGNNHYKYPITMPVVRTIAREWMKENQHLTALELAQVLTSLIDGESFTEKVLAGIMLDYAPAVQRAIPAKTFDTWLTHLEGWAEIDALCTGKFSRTEIPLHFEKWKPWLCKWAKSAGISKRRASLVFFISPIGHCDREDIARVALGNIEVLKHERDIRITKAISWLLRSMIRHHRRLVEQYIDDNDDSLPAVAVRETRIKLDTGRKGKPR
jgi:3-methyladenine DNA glycosylase AlkD